MNSTPKSRDLAIIGYLSALLLYVHLLVFIAILGIVIIRNRERGSDFSTFHLRQMCGIAAVAVLVSVFSANVTHPGLALLIISLMVLLAMLGLISAYKNQKTELPFIGRYFQQWFTFIK